MKTRTYISILLGVIGLIAVSFSLKQYAYKPTHQVMLLNTAATVVGKLGAPIKSNQLREQADRIANNRTMFVLDFASSIEYEKMSEAVWEGYPKKTKHLRIKPGRDGKTMEVTVDDDAVYWAKNHILDVRQRHRSHP